MVSPDNPFRRLIGSVELYGYSLHIIAYRLTPLGRWNLIWASTPETEKAMQMTGTEYLEHLHGLDAEAFVCLCIDLWEETHK
jgi:hypothetical protein